MSRIKLPTREEILELAQVRADTCVSIYVETSPIGFEKDHCRIELGNMVRQALERVENEAPGSLPFDKRRLAKLRETLESVTGSDDFCLNQSNSLALLATPDAYFTFQMPNHLQNHLEVSDRFYLKPLLRALTFDHRAYIMALSENQVRVVEMFPECPAEEIKVPDLPKSATDAVGLSSLTVGTGHEKDNSTMKKIRLGQYVRQVDDAMRAFLKENTAPLILVATEPLASMYRSQATVNLARETISSSPDHLSVSELSDMARSVLDDYFKEELDGIKALFDERTGQNRVVTDLGDVARAATYGQIDLALVDFDYSTDGVIDENGNITYSDDVSAYGVVDEIVKRALESGSKIKAVRREDMIGNTGVAAILRYTY